MKITDNQEALLSIANLKANEYGKIVTSTGEELTPSGIVDTYYPSLYENAVTQQVMDSLRGSKLLNNFISQEDWINGYKEIYFTGLFTKKNYSKTVAIGDFNPADETQYNSKWTIDFKEYYSKKFDRLGIIAAFRTPATLEAFINQEIKRMIDSFEYDLQNRQAKLLTQDTDAAFEFAYDLVVDTTGADTTDIMKGVKTLIRSFSTASPDHLALTDDTLVYSAQPNNLGIVFENSFMSEIDYANFVNYNPEYLVNGVQNDFIDLAKAGTTNTFKAVVLDKEAIVKGFKINGEVWNFKAPAGQEIQEIHYQYGFAVMPNYAKVIFMDVPAAPFKKTRVIDEKNKLKAIPKVIKLQDLIKNKK